VECAGALLATLAAAYSAPSGKGDTMLAALIVTVGYDRGE
jgi:hypothetical protein